MHKPSLKSTQVALMIADSLTGHVLNIDFQVYIDDESAVYFIFEDLQSVKSFIDSLNKKTDTYEYYIHNSEYTLVDFISAKKWS
jgi:hypothetical protein